MAHLFGKKERIYDERKQNFKITLEKLLANFSRMFIVELDNVTSNQMHQVPALCPSSPQRVLPLLCRSIRNSRAVRSVTPCVARLKCSLARTPWFAL